jgi:lipopolysaccharide export system permease protein
MKILDRYVLRSFLVNYLISFMVLIGMYIVLDMVFNFDELVDVRGAQQFSNLDVMTHIVSYYFYQTFLIFIHLSGIIPVMAAAFTLIRMSRNNELSAILAAGVPLIRISVPIIFCGVILSLILLPIDQELIIPNIIGKLTPKRDELNEQSAGKSYPIQAMQDKDNNVLFAGRFTPSLKTPPTMAVVDIIERDEHLRPMAHVLADAATWDPENERWKLERGRRISGLTEAADRLPDQRVNFYKSNITPEEIALYHSSEFVSLLSREKINQLIERKQMYGAMDLLRVKHFRISQLFMNLIMLLVAIPCVLTREVGKLKTSILKCLVLVGLCMASYFIAYQIAGRPPTGPEWTDRWPAMIAFAPVLIFGAVAVLLLDRLGTKDT